MPPFSFNLESITLSIRIVSFFIFSVSISSPTPLCVSNVPELVSCKHWVGLCKDGFVMFVVGIHSCKPCFFFPLRSQYWLWQAGNLLMIFRWSSACFYIGSYSCTFLYLSLRYFLCCIPPYVSCCFRNRIIEWTSGYTVFYISFPVLVQVAVRHYNINFPVEYTSQNLPLSIKTSS